MWHMQWQRIFRDGNRIYLLTVNIFINGPEVQCIIKGKEHKKLLLSDKKNCKGIKMG